MPKKSSNAEFREIFGDHDVYENSPPSPVTQQVTPAPSPNGSLVVDTAPDSPESPKVDAENLVVEEEDVIEKFTIAKADVNVAIEKPEVGNKINYNLLQKTLGISLKNNQFRAKAKQVIL
jgi:hypothetical protein